MKRREFFKDAALGGALIAATLPMAEKASAATTTTLSTSTTAIGLIDVTDPTYGADPSGLTSSAEAFVAAISAAKSNNTGIFIPAGTYDLESMATQTACRIVKGEHRKLVNLIGSNNKAFLYASSEPFAICGITASGFNIVVKYQADDVLSDIEITDCKFNDIFDSIFASGDGVNIRSMNSFIFSRNIVNNIGVTHDGSTAVVKLSAASCSTATISDNTINGVGSATKSRQSFGIHLRVSDAQGDNVSRSIIKNNIIKNILSNSMEDTVGIMLLGGQSVIEGNHLENVISYNPSSTDNEGIYTQCQNSVVSNNTLTNCGGNEAAIMVKGTNKDGTAADITGNAGYDNIISNNTIQQTKDYVKWSTGIHLTTDGCLVTNNHISGTSRGIVISKGVSNTIVSNNMMYALYHHDSAKMVSGISAQAPQSLQIIDNQISKLSSNSASYAIYITSADDVYSGCIIKGNWITDVESTDTNLSRAIAINLNTEGTCDRLIIESNHITNANYGLLGNNLQNCVHSAAIYNSFSGCSTDVTSATISALGLYLSI